MNEKKYEGNVFCNSVVQSSVTSSL